MSSEKMGDSDPCTRINRNEVVVCSGHGWQSQWDDFIEKSSVASIGHLSCWQRIIAQTYGHHTFNIMNRRDTEVLAVLPLIWLKGKLTGSALCSMPFLDYGGICAADQESGKSLFTEAIALRDSCNANYLELRHKDASANGVTFRKDKVDMVLDLSPGAEHIWKAMEPTVRNRVRKASKSGLITQMGGAENLEHFYKVFAVNMRDLGSPVHSPAFFANIFREFGERAKTVLVCDGSKTVGGLICLFFKDSVFVPWVSSLREYFSKCPNNILYWDMIQHAIQKGCQYFSFGRSSLGSGTHRFKQLWGAQEKQLNWEYYYREPTQTYTPMAESAKYRLAASIWKRLPLSLTMLLGPHIRKYLTN
jgi:FemAB-related protein (PEP-CTERM system-associated)